METNCEDLIRVAVCSSKVCVGYVPSHHPVSVKVISDFPDRALHHLNPPIFILVELGDNQVPEFAEQVFQLLTPLLLLAHDLVWRRTNSPTSDPFNAALYPPAVQHAKVDYAVVRRFHPTSPRSLQGR